MATPRRPRRKPTTRKPPAGLSGDFAADLANLNRYNDPDGDRTSTTKTQAAPTPRDEYQAALAEFNRYSDNNETADALAARERLDRAEQTRRRWWQR